MTEDSGLVRQLNCCNRYLTERPVSDVDENPQVRSFSQAPVVASDDKKGPIMFKPDGKKVTTDF
jgi:hypothetical protein